MALFWPIQLSKNNFQEFKVLKKLGGAERDRTADPLLAKQALSQLSYSPIFGRLPFKTRGQLQSPSGSQMVGLDRIELSTSRLSGVRSNHLSYRPSL